jgi:hypothetical protein
LDCGELQARRADSSISIYNYITYYFVTSTKDTAVGDMQAARTKLCDDFRQQTDEALRDVPNLVEKTAREMKVKGSVNNTKYLGVLAEDPHGCYAALLINRVEGNGVATLMYSVVLGAVIRHKQLFMAFYSKYGSAQETAKALRLAKTTAAALDAKNPE